MAIPYDPWSHALQDDPYPVYRRLRDESPVHHIPERDLWVLSRYDDVVAALRDPATFSSAAGVSLDALGPAVPTLITLDPPRHDELRRLVSRAFTPRRVAELAGRVRAIVREQLSPCLAVQSFDVMDLASGVPTTVIAELLGLPPGDREMFRLWVESVVTLDPSAVTDGRVDHGRLGELYDYLQAVIDEREDEPRDDLISALLAAEVDGERLRAPEVLGFTLVLLAAGFETTKNLIGNAVCLLAEHTEARAAAAEDPSRIPAVIEETLRYESPVVGLARTTTRDVRLHDITVPASAKVQLLFAAANRDERAFPQPDPELFVIDRPPERHIAFGHGIHHCLGASLARLEARVVFEELLGRVPEYVVVRFERLYSPYVRGFRSLSIDCAPVPARAGFEHP